jgi:cytochrome P450
MKTAMKNLPKISRFRSLKDASRMTKNPLLIFNEYMTNFGETYTFYFGGIRKTMVSSNPKIIQHVLQKNYSNYQKSDIQVKRMGHFLGSGLLTSHGNYWLTQRRLIQESFHKDKLIILMDIMDDVAKESLEQFDKEIEKGPVNINQQMTKFTFRLATKSLFSTNFNEAKLELLSSSITGIQEFIVRQIVKPFLIPWFKISGIEKKYEILRKQSDQAILDLIQNRRKNNNEYQDLLQNLIDAKYSETGEGMSDNQILMESMQLLVAAHETSSNALSWILYLLCKHPECLKKINRELDSVIGNAPLRYNKLRKLEYTIQVIEESLRIYPPFWIIDRVAMDDDIIDDVQIPRGTNIMLFLYGLHHSSEYWHEPEKFIPDRFSPDNKKKHVSFTHLPFGGGPRTCIGGNYAMIQMLLILTTLVRKYKFELIEEQKVEVSPLVILRPLEGIQLQFRKQINPIPKP